VRFSLNRFTTQEEIDEALVIIPEVLARIARSMPG